MGSAGYAEAEAADVVALMAPELIKAQTCGVTALVECTPVGVGRRADLLRAVSEASGVPLVVPTGIYREPWITPWAHAAAEAEIQAWMEGELHDQIEDTGVQAAWIKLSAGDDGITASERKILRAAAQAGARTNAVIGSHTIRGRVVMDQLDTIEAAGYTAERFIWIHASAEPDIALNLEAARRGAYIEYDWIGDPETRCDVHRAYPALDGCRLHRPDPAQPRPWLVRSRPTWRRHTQALYLHQRTLPAETASSRNHGREVEQLTRHNPFRAFAR